MRLYKTQYEWSIDREQYKIVTPASNIKLKSLVSFFMFLTEVS